jgi:hypothetical protein
MLLTLLHFERRFVQKEMRCALDIAYESLMVLFS